MTRLMHPRFASVPRGSQAKQGYHPVRLWGVVIFHRAQPLNAPLYLHFSLLSEFWFGWGMHEASDFSSLSHISLKDRILLTPWMSFVTTSSGIVVALICVVSRVSSSFWPQLRMCSRVSSAIAHPLQTVSPLYLYVLCVFRSNVLHLLLSTTLAWFG